MLTDMSDCAARTWLAMGFMSVVGFLVVVLLIVAIVAIGRYALTGGCGNRRNSL